MRGIFICLGLCLAGRFSRRRSTRQGWIGGKASREISPMLSRSFSKVTELAPTSRPALSISALPCWRSTIRAAVSPLKRSFELDPSLAGAEQMLGYALLSSGFAAEAIPHLEKTDTQDALGIAQFKTGKLPEAIANLNAALAKRPNDPDLLYYLGRASGLLRKKSSTRSNPPILTQPAPINRSPRTMPPCAKCPKPKPNIRPPSLRPDIPGVHLALGELYSVASEWPKAEDEFRAEAKLQPGDAEAAYRLGAARSSKTVKPKKRKRNSNSPTNSAQRCRRLCSRLGKAALLDGDLAEAEKAGSKSWPSKKTALLRNRRILTLPASIAKRAN